MKYLVILSANVKVGVYEYPSDSTSRNTTMDYKNYGDHGQEATIESDPNMLLSKIEETKKKFSDKMHSEFESERSRYYYDGQLFVKITVVQVLPLG